MRHPLRTLALAAALVLAASGRARAQIAVVVHPSNATTQLSMDELRRIFLGKTTSFHGAGRIEVAGALPSRDAFCRAALGLDVEQYRRRWMALAFRGEVQELPKELPDPQAVRRYVAEHPGAIAYLPLSAVDGDVRVVAIDGRRPTDPGYPLR